MDHLKCLKSPNAGATEGTSSPRDSSEPPSESPTASLHSSQCHDSKSLLDMWSGLHTDQISAGNGTGFVTGEDEMLVVRNTFLELCKLAEKQGEHNPDRFMSAPAAYSFPSENRSPQSTTETKSPTDLHRSPRPEPVAENAYNFPTPETPSSGAEESTVMVRNIPTRISAAKLVETVLSYRSPVTSLIDFLYLPIDFKTNKNLGYCFINFKSNSLAREFTEKFNQKKYLFCDTSEKMLQITLSNRQGYLKNLEVFTQTKLLDTWPPQFRPFAEFQGELVPIDSGLLMTILAPFVHVE